MAVYGVWQRDEATGGQVRHVIANYRVMKAYATSQEKTHK